MKKVLVAILIFAASLNLPAQTPVADSSHIQFAELVPEPEHRQVSQVVSLLLSRNHYLKRAIDDSLSTETYHRFLNNLDPNRMYFLDSDIQSFEKYRYHFDEYLRSGQVQAAYDIFEVYEKRVAERLEHIFALLEQPFDFSTDEYMEIDRHKSPWPSSSAEQDELWRKRLKNDALNLKLAGKDDEGIRSILRKRYQRLRKNVARSQSEDVFQLLMNAFAESYDPHTSYFSPKSSDDFKIQMSQSIEGIGARLSSDNDYTKVMEIVPGGPAARSGLLHPNDYITGVGQGVDGEIVDVIGWRIDDVVQLIRGKKSTVVRLLILRADAPASAPPDTIALVRDKVNLEEQSAKSDTVHILRDGQELVYGIIDIPAFYSDFEARRRGVADYKSTTRDVRRLLMELKEQDVDGIIIDLRRNGGGFLNEAVELAGLFIDSGPVVQVRNSAGQIDVERDDSPGQVYDGPLAVLIDRLSASASEIFAAAMQDYQRGIIIGSQSFGKGTVQNAVDLNRFIRDPDLKLGQLKMTIAKFYRVSGHSTQHVGIIPDIDFPSRLNHMEIGESSQKNALVWDEIQPVRHDNYANLAPLLPTLRSRHEARLGANPEYSKILAQIDEFEANKLKNQISLQETRRRQEREAAEKNDPERLAHLGNDQEEVDEDGADSTASVGTMRKKTVLKKDLLLRESAQVLADYSSLIARQAN